MDTKPYFDPNRPQKATFVWKKRGLSGFTVAVRLNFVNLDFVNTTAADISSCKRPKVQMPPNNKMHASSTQVERLYKVPIIKSPL